MHFVLRISILVRAVKLTVFYILFSITIQKYQTQCLNPLGVVR